MQTNMPELSSLDSSIRERATKCVFNINNALEVAVEVLQILPPIEETDLVLDEAANICITRATVLKNIIQKIEKEARDASFFLDSYIREVKDKKIYD